MSIFEKMAKKMGIIEEEEYEEVMEEENGEEISAVNVKPLPRRYDANDPFAQKGPEPIEEVKEPVRAEVQTKKEKKESKTGRITSLFSRKKKETEPEEEYETQESYDARVFMEEPKEFNDSEKVAIHLKEGYPVIVNMKHLAENHLKMRMHNFIKGVIYALGGTMQTIGNDIIICAPKNIDITGDLGIFSEPGAASSKNAFRKDDNNL